MALTLNYEKGKKAVALKIPVEKFSTLSTMTFI